MAGIWVESIAWSNFTSNDANKFAMDLTAARFNLIQKILQNHKVGLGNTYHLWHLFSHTIILHCNATCIFPANLGPFALISQIWIGTNTNNAALVLIHCMKKKSLHNIFIVSSFSFTTITTANCRTFFSFERLGLVVEPSDELEVTLSNFAHFVPKDASLWVWSLSLAVLTHLEVTGVAGPEELGNTNWFCHQMCLNQWSHGYLHHPYQCQAEKDLVVKADESRRPNVKYVLTAEIWQCGDM